MSPSSLLVCHTMKEEGGKGSAGWGQCKDERSFPNQRSSFPNLRARSHVIVVKARAKEIRDRDRGIREHDRNDGRRQDFSNMLTMAILLPVLNCETSQLKRTVVMNVNGYSTGQ